MKIDASRYRTFMTNPEEYRLRELWNLVPESSGGGQSCMTFGRRRGSAFHALLDGATPHEIRDYGDDAAAVAEDMFQANAAYSARLEETVVWREKEFCLNIPNSTHQMVGRIDTRMTRFEEDLILDYKTTKPRTKADMQNYRDQLSQSPQVDFYLSAVPDVRRFVFRILWKDAKKDIQISELEVTRQKWELEAFQRGVQMVCNAIEFWKECYGIEKPWPRALSLPCAPDRYPYRELYQRSIYEGMGSNLENFKTRKEHLAILQEEGIEDGT